MPWKEASQIKQNDVIIDPGGKHTVQGVKDFGNTVILKMGDVESRHPAAEFFLTED